MQINSPRSTTYFATHGLILFFGVFLLLQDFLTAQCAQGEPFYYSLKYLDEILPFLFLILLMLSRVAQGRFLYATPLNQPLVLFFLVGLLSGLVNKVPGLITLSQLVLYLKAFAIYYFLANLSFTKAQLKIYLKVFFGFGLIFLLIGVIDFLFTPSFRQLIFHDSFIEYVGGLVAVKSLFSHPTIFGWFMSSLALFSLTFAYFKGKISYFFYALLFIIGCLFSFRLRIIMGMLASLLLGFVFYLPRQRLKLLFLLIIVVLVGLFFLWPALNNLASLKFKTYIFNVEPNQIARTMLYSKALLIARDYFPLGAGPGRYGSFLSALYYSPLYEAYGLNLIPGLSQEKISFITDTFWPMVLGETGFLGLACYLVILLFLFKKQLDSFKNARISLFKAFHLAALMVLIKGLCESIADPFLTAPPQAFFILGLLGISASLARCERQIQVELN